MKNRKRGFTLIELLVVVLIIGILAAVALPQYQKAVEKSRAAQVLSLLRSLAEANKVYYLANGTYADKFDQLDVSFDGWSGTEDWCVDPSVTDRKSNGDWSLQIVNGPGDMYFFVGRLRGKYKGGGFGFYMKDFTANLNEILCLERRNRGVILEGEEGAYCEKVIGAKFSSAAGNTRKYTMP